MNWLIVFAIIFAIWKLAPKRLSSLTGDVLKLEWIRELQARSAERNKLGLSPEEVNQKFAKRVAAISVGAGAVTMLATSSWPIYIAVSLAISSTVVCAITAFRVTRHRRTVVLPLYLTLCRIPGSRWDSTHPPTRYLRIPQKSGKPLMVRLPMDWHAGPMQLREVEAIVRSRVPGEWKMEVNSTRFLLTFHPVTTSVVDVGAEQIFTADTVASPVVSSEEETIDILMKEEEGPW